MSEKVLIISADDNDYSVERISHYSLTIGELIDKLKYFDKDTKVIIGNDKTSYGFYTYSEIDTIYEAEIEDDDIQKMSRI